MVISQSDAGIGGEHEITNMQVYFFVQSALFNILEKTKRLVTCHL